MIDIQKRLNNKPYKIFYESYENAQKNDQKNIEACVISSYAPKTNEPDSRIVNIKYIINDEWIFFSSYESKKSSQFLLNNKIACLFFWETINMQIRIKARISKTKSSFSDHHFSTRSKFKNALAISSRQSSKIDSFKKVKENFQETLQKGNLSKRPQYWGGYTFIPYSFEFWEGDKYRINKRNFFSKGKNSWKNKILQP